MDEQNTKSPESELGTVTIVYAALRSGTVAGLAMVPFAAMFRGLGLRVNEYGRKTLELTMGQVESPLRELLMFVQHMLLSWAIAIPLLLVLARIASRRQRLLAGVAYGAAFYVLMNSLVLPLAFGDPTPWQLGTMTVLPSLWIHLVYGAVVAWMVGPELQAFSARRR